MNIEIKKVGPDEWAALCNDLDPRVPHEPLATGKTKEECLADLFQWMNDRATRGLKASDPIVTSPTVAWSVEVTPNPRPDHQNCASVEATLQLTDGKAVLRLVGGDTMSKELAATVGKALKEREVREIKFDPQSDTQGQMFVMWDGKSFPVGFFLAVEGPEYLYARVKNALRQCVSKEW